MTRISMITRIAIPAMLAGFAAGCVGSSGTNGGSPAAVQSSAVEGSWVDEGGVGISNFTSGIFSTTAMENGNRLSEGTYRYTGNNSVAITGMSLIRQQPIAFNCTIASRSQLNCASSDGNRFVLNRRA